MDDSGPEPALPLRALRCRRCGRAAVPVQDFGCESCGAHDLDLEEVELSGRGVVLALTTVHRHPAPAVEPPFTLGSVRLDEGPVVRALLHGPELRAGAPVVVDLAADGRPAFAVRHAEKETDA
ncbi:OB-fold domain-containing protein [Streptomyces sp. NPDC048277]|uniref:Zn-ribbon domain-containing OB-fold protein n=1 Tax=Streptomyces sp. NPDC048277 TaxID=3155027 RepID=UPI0033CB2810